MRQHPPDQAPSPFQMPRADSVLLPDFCTDEQLSRFLGIPAPEVVAAIERGEIPASRDTSNAASRFNFPARKASAAILAVRLR